LRSLLSVARITPSLMVMPRKKSRNYARELSISKTESKSPTLSFKRANMNAVKSTITQVDSKTSRSNASSSARRSTIVKMTLRRIPSTFISSKTSSLRSPKRKRRKRR